jgi:hypothetical protein
MVTAALLGTLLVLALVDSTSIGTLVVPVWLLTAPGPVRVGRMATYLLTIAAFYALVGLSLAFGARALVDPLSGAWSDLTDRLPADSVPIAQLAIGAALFAWSFRISRRGKEGGSGRIRAWRDRSVAATSPRPLVALALTGGAIEVATMVPYLGALGAITAAELDAPLVVALVFGYCLVMVLPAAVLTVGRVALDERVRPLLTRLDAWLQRNAAEAVSWMVGIVGVWLALNAIGRLGWLDNRSGFAAPLRNSAPYRSI